MKPGQSNRYKTARNLFLLLALLAVPFVCAAAARAGAAGAPDRDHVRITLAPERANIAPGETIYLSIHQQIDPGWHTYWVNPGDSGASIRIDWTLPPGFETGGILWPVPQKIPYGSLMNFGYEDEVTLLVPLTASQTLPEGPQEITADIELLVCSDICIPQFGSYRINLNDSASSASGRQVQNAMAAMPVSSASSGTYREEAGRFIVRWPLPEGFTAEAADVLPREWGVIENARTPSETRENGILTIEKPRGERPIAMLGDLRVLITQEAENGRTVGGYEVVLSPDPDWKAGAASPASGAPSGGNVTTGDETAGESESAAASAGQTPSTGAVQPFTFGAFFNALVFALMGGLILNLMPCVFPILSMKALALCAMAEKSRRDAAEYGIAYTAGILCAFTVLVLLLLGARAAGAQVGWGFQLQNPVIVLALAMLLFLLGLSLSGFFEIKGRFTSAGSTLAAREGVAGSFFTGMLATVVATPCTAPFMGIALGFALLQPPLIALTIFWALGLGLALPYLALALLPGLRARLPRPGAWMERFKEFLAFPLYLSSALLVWVLAQQIGPNAVLYALFSFTGLTAGLWVLRYRPEKSRLPRLLATAASAALLIGSAAAALSAAAQAPAAAVRAAAPRDAEAAEIPYAPERLAALRAEGRPVFVNMTAAWCITCKVNERVAIDREATRRLFQDRRIVMMKGDWTNYDAEITAFLKDFSRSGVPLYVFYPPRGADGADKPPVILPQLLTPEILADALGGAS